MNKKIFSLLFLKSWRRSKASLNAHALSTVNDLRNLYNFYKANQWHAKLRLNLNY